MIHLQAELSKRRDKRLELAGRRRDYEVINVTKRRKLDDDGVWSWWKVREYQILVVLILITICDVTAYLVTTRRASDGNDLRRSEEAQTN